MNNTILESFLRQQALDRLASALRYRTLPGGKGVYFRPKLYWIAQNAGHHGPQPWMFLRQHYRMAAAFQTPFVTGKNGITGILGLDLQPRFPYRDVRARCQAH